jgi:hypothetical protein
MATSNKVILPPALGTYAFIWKARPPMSGEGPDKFSITLLWPKAQKKLLKPLEDAILAAAIAKFGPKAGEAMKAGKLHNPLRDGDTDAPDSMEKVAKGHYFLRAASERQPQVVDRAVQPIIDPSEAFSGCTFRASVAIFAFDKAGKKGVSCGLNNLQVLAKGKRIDGQTDAADEFKAEPEDEKSDPME